VLFAKYYWGYDIKGDEMDRTCVMHGGDGRDHSEDRQRWEDNIKLDLTETVWEGVDWVMTETKYNEFSSFFD
jgi:hypothetical protein